MNPPAAVPEHNAAAQRFELLVDGQCCEASYQLRGQTMHLVHTEVPRALEGRGLAGIVVQAALDHARSQGLKVRPVCSYVRVYMQRHPETRDLLET